MYVGKGILISRLQSHGRERARWTYGVTLATRDRSLDDPHVCWAEAALIARARSAGWVELLNDRDEVPPSLPDDDLSRATAFLRDAEVILGLVGLPITEVRAAARDRPRPEVTVPKAALAEVAVDTSPAAVETALLARVEARRGDWAWVAGLAGEIGLRRALGHTAKAGYRPARRRGGLGIGVSSR